MFPQMSCLLEHPSSAYFSYWYQCCCICAYLMQCSPSIGATLNKSIGIIYGTTKEVRVSTWHSVAICFFFFCCLFFRHCWRAQLNSACPPKQRGSALSSRSSCSSLLAPPSVSMWSDGHPLHEHRKCSAMIETCHWAGCASTSCQCVSVTVPTVEQ